MNNSNQIDVPVVTQEVRLIQTTFHMMVNDMIWGRIIEDKPMNHIVAIPIDDRQQGKTFEPISNENYDNAQAYLLECRNITQNNPYQFCDACGEMLDLNGKCGWGRD